MSPRTIFSVISITILGSLAMGSVGFAQDAPVDRPSNQGQGMMGDTNPTHQGPGMMGGNMPEMMNMMRQMTRMMENCNRMMENADHQPPTREKSPETQTPPG
jgi:hypothetical protein